MGLSDLSGCLSGCLTLLPTIIGATHVAGTLLMRAVGGVLHDCCMIPFCLRVPVVGPLRAKV
jgi:hypothetical protein